MATLKPFDPFFEREEQAFLVLRAAETLIKAAQLGDFGRLEAAVSDYEDAHRAKDRQRRIMQ